MAKDQFVYTTQKYCYNTDDVVLFITVSFHATDFFGHV